MRQVGQRNTVTIYRSIGKGIQRPLQWSMCQHACHDEEFAGATFSDDGHTLFVNILGPPGVTFAIWGPWQRRTP